MQAPGSWHRFGVPGSDGAVVGVRQAGCGAVAQGAVLGVEQQDRAAQAAGLGFDAAGQLVDTVAYSSASPWAIGADALGWRHVEETDAAGRQRIVRDDAEAETVERIAALRGEGLSLRRIADVLTSEGRATKRGGRWAAETVAKVLERAAA